MRFAGRSIIARDIHPGLRLALSVALGWAVYLSAPDAWGIGKRCALGWIIAVAFYLALLSLALGDAAPERLRTRARTQDPSRWVIQMIDVLAALVSLAAVAALLQKQPDETSVMLVLRVGLAGVVVVSSWMLIHFVFAVHYAHSYYGDRRAPGKDAGGLEFPGGGGMPDFWDLVYFSLVIGMTCQVSDVQISGKHMRRLATLHGALSFFFNTIILALTVNFVVSAL